MSSIELQFGRYPFFPYWNRSIWKIAWIYLLYFFSSLKVLKAFDEVPKQNDVTRTEDAVQTSAFILVFISFWSRWERVGRRVLERLFPLENILGSPGITFTSYRKPEKNITRKIHSRVPFLSFRLLWHPYDEKFHS